MSCEGWGVGDKCVATTAMKVDVLTKGVPGTFQVRTGDEGVVSAKDAVAHSLTVFWSRSLLLTHLDHRQVHNLRKLSDIDPSPFKGTPPGVAPPRAKT